VFAHLILLVSIIFQSTHFSVNVFQSTIFYSYFVQTYVITSTCPSKKFTEQNCFCSSSCSVFSTFLPLLLLPCKYPPIFIYKKRNLYQKMPFSDHFQPRNIAFLKTAIFKDKIWLKYGLRIIFNDLFSDLFRTYFRSFFRTFFGPFSGPIFDFFLFQLYTFFFCITRSGLLILSTGLARNTFRFNSEHRYMY
jgi:hypothetical protein